MRYTHVFWDFNGTVIDDVGNALACVNDMLARHGRAPITLADYYTYIETPIIGFYRHILPPEELDFDEIAREFHDDYFRHLDETKLADGAYELLHRLHDEGVRQHIITATAVEEAEELTARYGVRDCFESILGAQDNYAGSKIDRALAYFESLGIDRREAVYVGDCLHDLQTADALGIDCVLVAYGHQGKRLLREHNAFVVDSLRDVERILRDERRVDFHTHSTCSDGTLTPTELVDEAQKQGLTAFALTDHDAVDGIAEAQAEAARIGMEFIPGIEFSAADTIETHVIGLFIDPQNEVLQATIAKLKASRRRRMEDVCRKLTALGLPVSYDEAQALAGGGFVGRAHIAKVMVQKGFCPDVKSCFTQYIGVGKPAYSEKHELTAGEAVRAIKAAGGLAFLAHLNQTGLALPELETLLTDLKREGLDGIEGYYTEYTPQQTADYRLLAEKLSLALSGGSDYHAAMKPHVGLGTGTGNLTVPYFLLDHFKEMLHS